MTSNWKIWPHDVPESGMVCVALYSDGSGAFLFYVDDDGTMRDMQDDELSAEYFDQDVQYWCELPEHFTPWEWQK